MLKSVEAYQTEHPVSEALDTGKILGHFAKIDRQQRGMENDCGPTTFVGVFGTSVKDLACFHYRLGLKADTEVSERRWMVQLTLSFLFNCLIFFLLPLSSPSPLPPSSLCN